MTNMDEIRFSESPSSDARSRVAEQLENFNRRAAGHEGGTELGAFIERDEEVVAGIVGWVWGGTSYIDLLWVTDLLRHEGIGTRLLKGFEKEAKKRGALQTVLTSGSFQAPEFYKRHGYEVIGEVPEHPVGHTEFTLRKAL